MRDFLHITPTNTMRDLVTITNLNAVSSQFEDSLDVHRLSTGIIWTGKELIEGVTPSFQTNVPIASTNLINVHFQNMKIFFASLNKLINIDDLYLDFSQYTSAYLSYLIMYDDLSYEFVLQKPEDYQSNRIVLGRIFKPSNQVIQFYFCPPHVDATHFELSYPWYEFCDGGEPDLKVNKTLAFGPAELKFPSLNFSHAENRNVVIYPAVNPAQIRTSAAGNSVDYDNLYTQINTTKYLRNNMDIVDIPTGKFALSRFYLDPYESVLIQQYGTETYATLFDAMTEYQTYHQPDPNNKYDYVPLGALIYEAGVSDLTNRDKVRWYTDHDKKEDSSKDDLYAIDLVCREILELFQQQVDERFVRVENRCTALENRCTILESRCDNLEVRMAAAEANIDNLWTTLNAHINNKSNPHQVTKAQVGLGNVENYGIATKAEAQAGSSNQKYMTPLRTKEGVEFYGVMKLTANGTPIKVQVGGNEPSAESGTTILWFSTV